MPFVPINPEKQPEAVLSKAIAGDVQCCPRPDYY
jgi:hypothetical protein